MRLHHIHLRASRPEEVASWLRDVFDCEIVADVVRPGGDRLIKCRIHEDDPVILVSSERDGETLQPATVLPRYGIDHFCLESLDLDADLKRAIDRGAVVQEGPMMLSDGVRAVFLAIPGDARIEIIQLPTRHRA